MLVFIVDWRWIQKFCIVFKFCIFSCVYIIYFTLSQRNIFIADMYEISLFCLLRILLGRYILSVSLREYYLCWCCVTVSVIFRQTDWIVSDIRMSLWCFCVYAVQVLMLHNIETMMLSFKRSDWVKLVEKLLLIYFAYYVYVFRILSVYDIYTWLLMVHIAICLPCDVMYMCLYFYTL